MSYDLFVWCEPNVEDTDTVFELIDAACDGDPETLVASPRIGDFLSELFAEYPPLTQSSAADTPWSCTDDTSDRHALLSVQDGGQPVCRRIVSLAKKHSLNCFDLQSGELR